MVAAAAVSIHPQQTWSRQQWLRYTRTICLGYFAYPPHWRGDTGGSWGRGCGVTPHREHLSRVTTIRVLLVSSFVASFFSYVLAIIQIFCTFFVSCALLHYGHEDNRESIVYPPRVHSCLRLLFAARLNLTAVFFCGFIDHLK